jgi:hypothetical protein
MLKKHRKIYVLQSKSIEKMMKHAPSKIKARGESQPRST